jgi:hypothetical protein
VLCADPMEGYPIGVGEEWIVLGGHGSGVQCGKGGHRDRP